MNIAVVVIQAQVDGGAIRLVLSIATNQGHQVGSDIVLDFGASAQTMNNRISEAARNALTNSGVTVPSNANVKIFGGAV